MDKIYRYFNRVTADEADESDGEEDLIQLPLHRPALKRRYGQIDVGVQTEQEELTPPSRKLIKRRHTIESKCSKETSVITSIAPKSKEAAVTPTVLNLPKVTTPNFTAVVEEDLALSSSDEEEEEEPIKNNDKSIANEDAHTAVNEDVPNLDEDVVATEVDEDDDVFHFLANVGDLFDGGFFSTNEVLSPTDLVGDVIA